MNPHQLNAFHDISYYIPDEALFVKNGLASRETRCFLPETQNISPIFVPLSQIKIRRTDEFRITCWTYQSGAERAFS